MNEQRRTIDPIYGWRRMGAANGTAGPHLLGAHGGILTTSLSEDAVCEGEVMVRSDRDAGDAPHAQAVCPSARIAGSACGYYALFEPDLSGLVGVPAGPSEAVWCYVQAIGKTILHDDGFRTARYRVVALVGCDVPKIQGVCQRLGVPLITAETPIEEIQRVGLPLGPARRLARRATARPESEMAVATMKPAWSAQFGNQGWHVSIQPIAPPLPPTSLHAVQVMGSLFLPPPEPENLRRSRRRAAIVGLASAVFNLLMCLLSLGVFAVLGHHWYNLLAALVCLATGALSARIAWRGRRPDAPWR